MSTTAMTMSPMSKVVNIFTAPADVFRSLQQKPTVLLPLALILLANTITVLWYYNVVDLVWVTETSLERAGIELPEDQREQILESVGDRSPMVTAVISAIASCVIVVLFLLLSATYLWFVSLFTNDGHRYKQWFSLSTWSALPILLSQIAAMVNIAVSDARFLAAEDLNPLALGNLLGIEATGGLGGALLTYVDVMSLWSLGLAILGYKLWTGRTTSTSALIVAAPLLAIIAIAALTAAL